MNKVPLESELAAKHFELCFAANIVQSFPFPSVMGVLNTSPYSFHQSVTTLSEALFLAEKMATAGAAFIDIGAYATNPKVNLDNLSEQQELDWLLPFIEAIANRVEIYISADTSRPKVMRLAVQHGAHLINHQKFLDDESMQTVKELDVPVCIMHFFEGGREPEATTKRELFAQIRADLYTKAKRCEQIGIQKNKIIIDPGFGQGNYGKNTAENFYLLSRLVEFTQHYPVLIGWSRKSMIGDVLKLNVEDRLIGSIAAATIASMQGAAILRVHDVIETMQAVKIVQELFLRSEND